MISETETDYYTETTDYYTYKREAVTKALKERRICKDFDDYIERQLLKIRDYKQRHNLPNELFEI